MPLTLIATLSASMLYALVFTPPSARFSRGPHRTTRARRALHAARRPRGPPSRRSCWRRRSLCSSRCRWHTDATARGSSSSRTSSPSTGCCSHARGNLSIHEKDALVRQAEARMAGWPSIESVYTRVGGNAGQGGEDVDEESSVSSSMSSSTGASARALTTPRPASRRDDRHPGADVEVSVPNAGPPTGKAIRVQLSAVDPAGLDELRAGSPRASRHAGRDRRLGRSARARRGLGARGRPGKGVAVRCLHGCNRKCRPTRHQRTEAHRFPPGGRRRAVDIRIRLPEDRRTFATLDSLRIETAAGSVPIANFVQRSPVRTSGILSRIDGRRTVTVEAGIRAGVQADPVRQAVAAAVDGMGLGQQGIRWKLAGEDEEQKAAGAFLVNAFAAAVALISRCCSPSSTTSSRSSWC